MEMKEELIFMQKNPNLYLNNYFTDLKQQVNLTFFGREDEKEKWNKIIYEIQVFEQVCYKQIKPFNTFDQEINALEPFQSREIDDLKYKIEQKLFQNKSILFLKDYGYEKKTFLLIINNVYLRKNEFEKLTRIELPELEHLIIRTLKEFGEGYEKLLKIII